MSNKIYASQKRMDVSALPPTCLKSATIVLKGMLVGDATVNARRPTKKRHVTIRLLAKAPDPPGE